MLTPIDPDNLECGLAHFVPMNSPKIYANLTAGKF
jgi:hypothetical protein